MEKEEILEAKIKVYFKESPLSKYRIEIIENEKLAFDHPKFIGYGLLYLREQGIIKFPELMESNDDK